MPSLTNPVTFPYQVTDVFGSPRSYAPRTGHEGIDIAPRGGTSRIVVSAAPGIVEKAGWSAVGYGNYVVINHGNGVETLYGHLANTPTVQVGQRVNAGTGLGIVGRTGNATGVHLHFSILENGRFVNPIPFLTGKANLPISGIPNNMRNVAAQSIPQRAINTPARAATLFKPIRPAQVTTGPETNEPVTSDTGSPGSFDYLKPFGNYLQLNTYRYPYGDLRNVTDQVDKSVNSAIDNAVSGIGEQLTTSATDVGTNAQTWFIKNRGYIIATIIILFIALISAKEIVS